MIENFAPRPPVISLLITSVVLLAGCGGSGGSGGDSPEQVTEDFFGAIADQDVARACELVTEETAQAAADSDPNAGSCEEGLTAAFDAGGADAEFAQAGDIVVGDATIDGDSATVEITSGDQTDEATLVKVDDEWKVDLAA